MLIFVENRAERLLKHVSSWRLSWRVSRILTAMCKRNYCQSARIASQFWTIFVRNKNVFIRKKIMRLMKKTQTIIYYWFVMKCRDILLLLAETSHKTFPFYLFSLRKHLWCLMDLDKRDDIWLHFFL